MTLRQKRILASVTLLALIAALAAITVVAYMYWFPDVIGMNLLYSAIAGIPASIITSMVIAMAWLAIHAFRNNTKNLFDGVFKPNEFLQMCAAGNTKYVESALKFKQDQGALAAAIEVDKLTGENGLHKAIKNRRLGCALLLIEKLSHKDLILKDKQGYTPLMMAITWGNKEVRNALTAKLQGVEIDIQGPHGNTVLHYCVEHRNVNFLKYFLRANADRNIKNDAKQTPLEMHQAIMAEGIHPDAEVCETCTAFRTIGATA